MFSGMPAFCNVQLDRVAMCNGCNSTILKSYGASVGEVKARSTER